MRFKTLNGRQVYRNIEKCRIDWDKKCASKFQFAIKQFFRPFWSVYVCYEEMPVFGTRLRVDMVNVSKRIAVEAQGTQHDEYNEFFFKNREAYGHALDNDRIKYRWLELNDFEILELREDELPLLSPEYIKNEHHIII